MSVNKKKVATSVTAVGLAALLLLGGTFAWQSISQTALNEASNVVNPGGRLHDDFDGENKDVYVENFADDAIYARIRLDEYFEIVQNKGTPAETINAIAGTKDADGNIETWETHYFGSENSTDEYWEWLTGGSTTYMPTFNKNKDSLAADVNGTYNGLDGIVTDEDSDDRYTDYVEYADGETKTDDAIYDADTNDTEDENVTNVSEEHTAQSTLGATLMSMQEWIDEGSQPGEYWVYDTDGWVYWAQAIKPDTATGLLLDGIELTQVMDDSWYYAINVIAQFITADDLGKSDNTGFYADGETVSDDALALLEAIGVDVSGEANDDDDDGEPTVTDRPLDVTISYADGSLAGAPPTNPETGKTEDGVTQIFALLIEEKDLYLGGQLTLDDGSVINSEDEDSNLEVTFSLEKYTSNMLYAFSLDDDEDIDYTFSISTIEDTESEYYGYKVVTCDQTNEQMMVLNETTGHMKMLAEDQPVNQAVYVVAKATYNGVEYESNLWELFFVNRDIILFTFAADETTPEYGATYTSGTASTYKLKPGLYIQNELVEDLTDYPITWTVLDADGNVLGENDPVTLVYDSETQIATITVSEEATSAVYTVIARYTHDGSGGMNAGNYDDSWSVTNENYNEDDEEPFDAGNLQMSFYTDEMDERLDCDETMTVTVAGYDDMSLFDWEIVEGGVYADDSQPGVFTHYGEDTEEYNNCPCKTIIKATLKSDSSQWGAIQIDCA